jgi:alkanesulfonate monooxygenase SsuD/methylene tetrahydromethanopterin reductase-like flavin-dependent oxidoreductase (luciferase family)
MLRLVGEHADIWNWFGEPEVFAERNPILDDWARKAGRDPSAIERSALIKADEVERADEYAEAGVTHLIYESRAPQVDFGPLRWLVEWRDEAR